MAFTTTEVSGRCSPTPRMQNGQNEMRLWFLGTHCISKWDLQSPEGSTRFMAADWGCIPSLCKLKKWWYTNGWNWAVFKIPLSFHYAGWFLGGFPYWISILIPNILGSNILGSIILYNIWFQYIWANYNNSLTWNKAILGWFPLLTMISRVRS